MMVVSLGFLAEAYCVKKASVTFEKLWKECDGRE